MLDGLAHKHMHARKHTKSHTHLRAHTRISAGLFMACAMAAEMGFLGLSFALSVVKLDKRKAVPALVAGPMIMVIGSIVGGVLANVLAASEPLLVGCTAFGGAGSYSRLGFGVHALRFFWGGLRRRDGALGWRKGGGSCPSSPPLVAPH